MEKPPYTITPHILELVSRIQELLGEIKYYTIVRPPLKLRRQNKIKTIHHSLAIEGNSLTEDQITALLEDRRVLGPKKQILEAQNALKLYDQLESLNPLNSKHLLNAHSVLMEGLTTTAGKYRSTSVGIIKGQKVSHLAPPYKQVPHLMKNIFQYLAEENQTPWLIKACVFHYELEFIHPFEDGNGRMGRLWQQLILMKHSTVFEFIPVESLIHKYQKKYYQALEASDKAGDSTAFIEFSLEMILKALKEFKSSFTPKKPTSTDRINTALETFNSQSFSRKDYMQLFPEISTATASRDLAEAVKTKQLVKNGTKAVTLYKSLKPKQRKPKNARST